MVSYCHFLTVTGPAARRAEARDWFEGAVLAVLSARTAVRSINLFTPEGAHDPYLDDGDGPLLLVESAYDDIAAVAAVTNTPPLGLSLSQDAFEVSRQRIAGQAVERTAEISYVVRYHRPAEDEAAFKRFYLAHHPPILAELPGVRNVRCYLPVAWSGPPSDCMLGNEVVFDSLEALEAALASDVRDRLRADYRRFPPFTGPVSHHAMRRVRVHSRG